MPSTLQIPAQDGIPARYSLAILAFFGFVFNYMLRINMSVAIVAMVNQTATKSQHSHGNISFGTLCQLPPNSTGDHEIRHTEEGEFDWDEKTQALISGSFFFGYIFTQFPGGRLAELYGAKYIFGFSIFFAGVVNVLIPFAAAQNPIYLIILRILLGVFEGPTYPSMHALLAHWAPPSEKSRLISIVYSGSEAGTIIAFPLAGFLSSLWGWKSVFFVMGFSSFIWFIFWMLFAFDNPESHPRISEKEKQLLSHNNISHNRSKDKKVPWKSILTSMPFWAIVVCSVSCNWGFWMFIQELPTYMKNVLGFDIKENSLLSALPYTVMWIFGLIYGFIADKLRQISCMNRKITMTLVRKISAFVSLVLPGICIMLVTFVGCDSLATVALFTIAMGFSGAQYSAYLANHIDLAPNYAGTLLGLANSIVTIPGWLAPLVAGHITNGQQSLENWYIVFYITTGFCTFGFIFYWIFGSGEIQPWNEVGGEGSQDQQMSEIPIPKATATAKEPNANSNVNVDGTVPVVWFQPLTCKDNSCTF